MLTSFSEPYKFFYKTLCRNEPIWPLLMEAILRVDLALQEMGSLHTSGPPLPFSARTFHRLGTTIFEYHVFRIDDKLLVFIVIKGKTERSRLSCKKHRFLQTVKSRISTFYQ